MRVVFDANVYLSGIPRLRDQDSPPRKLIAAWLDGAFELVISDHIIEEVIRNLEKPYFAALLRGVDAVSVFQEIRQHADVVEVEHEVHLPRMASHPEDDYVLATVIKGKADYLVTGDRQLRNLFSLGSAMIVSPVEMLEIVASRDRS